MLLRVLSSAAMAAIGVLAAGVEPAHADPENAFPREIRTVEQTRQSVERAIDFIEKDAAKWRTDKKCASCHHGLMTVWALSEAKARGYPVTTKTIADMTAWTKERIKDIDKPRDTRPGFSMVNTPALYLAVMAQAVPEQAAVSADELKQIASHLVQHQETDGSWAWSAAPAKNRPPPVFESDEVATVMAHLALAPHVPTDPKAKSDARESRERASIWLLKAGRSETTQSLGIRLFRDVRAGVPASDVQSRVEHLMSRQNNDGGWGQEADLPSDAYATGQALYFLSLAGVKPDRTELQRGVNFLVGSQKEDGSWPMKSRSHPGATPMTNPVPITYFGSAWATMGLVRVVPR